MENSTLWLGLALFGATLVIGLVIKLTQGQSKTIDSAEVIDLKRIGATKNGFPISELGRKATLLQFSTQYCGQCPGVARLLARMEYRDGGLSHVEVDITDRIELAAHFSITQTPTVFILDNQGRIRSRISGVPKPGVIQQELERLEANG